MLNLIEHLKLHKQTNYYYLTLAIMPKYLEPIIKPIETQNCAVKINNSKKDLKQTQQNDCEETEEKMLRHTSIKPAYNQTRLQQETTIFK